jgi:hypothetical protein
MREGRGEMGFQGANTGGTGGGRTKKAGELFPIDFSGDPLKATVTFDTPFPSADYAPSLSCITNNDVVYALTAESVTATGFVINLGTGVSTDLTCAHWTATLHGEE